MTGPARSRRALGNAFADARVPEVSEFAGEYSVDMLTMLPSLRRFSHRKVFVREGAAVTGWNVLLRDRPWGRFRLETGVVPGPDLLPAVVINYGVAGNSLLTRGIRDYIRALDNGTRYLGRFTLLVRGRSFFLGYFSLTRIVPHVSLTS